MDRTCRTCAYHDSFSWVCFNGESEHRADITMKEQTCRFWSAKPTGEWIIKQKPQKAEQKTKNRAERRAEQKERRKRP